MFRLKVLIQGGGLERLSIIKVRLICAGSRRDVKKGDFQNLSPNKKRVT